MKCKICGKEAKNKEYCSGCQNRIKHRIIQKKMTEEEAVEDIKKSDEPKICKMCDRKVMCRNLCYKHYRELLKKENKEKQENSKYTKRQLEMKRKIENSDDKYFFSFVGYNKKEKEKVEEPIEEYMKDRYDDDLLEEIAYYKQTGKVVKHPDELRIMRMKGKGSEGA